MVADKGGGSKKKRAGGPDPRNPGVGNNPPGGNYDDTEDRSSSGGRSKKPKPLGVEEGYTTPVMRGTPFNYNDEPRAARPQRPQQLVNVGPTYFDGDQFVPARYHPNSIIKLQERMHSVGLLGGFRRGIWDADSAAAYADLLGYANSRGITADQAIREMEQSATATGTLFQGGRVRFDPTTGQWVPDDGGTGASTRAPLVIKQSDPMELEQVFDDAVIKTLGVGWDKGRIQNMVRAYQDLEAQRQREAYDRELTGGSVIEIPSPTSFATNFAQEQNPEGAKKEKFLDLASNTLPLLSQGAWGVG